MQLEVTGLINGRAGISVGACWTPKADVCHDPYHMAMWLCMLLTNGSIRKSQEIYTLKAYWFKVISLIILQSNNVFCNVNNWLLTYLLCKLSFFIEYFFLMGRKPELKFRDKLTFKVKSKWLSVLPYYFKINLFWDNVFKLCSV